MPLPTNTEYFRPVRRRLFALLALLTVSFTGPAPAQTGPIEDLDHFPQSKLEITVGKKPIAFDIWVADTPQRMAQGLMFVRSLPALRGMLFVHDSPKPVSMWMKNTYIPLDMVFIDPKGRVQEIVEQTTPHSLDIIRSKDPALAVLEIGGGEAKRLGLKAGQHVSHPAFARH